MHDAAPAGRRERLTGTLAALRRRRFEVRLDDGERLGCMLKGRHTVLACGDRVSVSRSGAEGVIEDVLPRQNLLYRSDAFKARLLAANVTQIVGVLAPDLPVDLELVDRWSIAAGAAGSKFLIVANKADLPGFSRLLERVEPWRALGYAVLGLSALQDVAPLAEAVTGEHSVLVGQSGMGKSTLLNALAPDAQARTAAISSALRTGRHTTTETSLYFLGEDPAQGWIVDAPGMRAFALAHLDAATLEAAFVELRPYLGQCRFRDCRHGAEPGCAVHDAVQRGEIAPHRLRLLQAMLAESTAGARTQGAS